MKWLENGQPLPGPTKIIGAATLGKYGRARAEHIDQIDQPEHIKICLSCPLAECVGRKSMYCPIGGTRERAKYVKCDDRIVSELYKNGVTITEIARQTGASARNIRYHLQKLGLLGAAG